MISTPTIKLEDLLDLREELCRIGFDAGLQRAIAAQNLLLALASQGRLPADPRDWRTWLAPVFCAAPGEQEEFYRRYDAWVQRRPALIEQVAEVTQAQPTVSGAIQGKNVRSLAFRRLVAYFQIGRLKGELRTHLRSFARPQEWIPALVVLLLAILTWGWLQRQTTFTLTGQVFGESESHPLAGAEVWLANQLVQTDALGKFSINYQINNLELLRQNKIEWLRIKYPGYYLETANVVLPFTEPQKVILQKQAELERLPAQRPLTPSPTPEQPPLPIQSNTSLKLWQIAIILSSLLLYALWLLWRWWRWRALLQKLPASGMPQLQDLRVEGTERKLFASSRVRRLLLSLRRPRPMPMRELDVPATVQATIRRGGMFTPAYGARRSSPEYLLLIDRASAHDEQANVADELHQRLAENGVFVEPYYFQGDARSCRRAVKDEAAITLQQLVARHPEHRLLVFGDGAGFFEPFTGRPQRWLEQFTPWEQRVLLTPEAPACWGYRERELGQRDFLLLPASAEGIEELGEWLSYGVAPAPRKPIAQPFPELIEERQQRWLERHAPLPEEIDELHGQVRAYLGQDGWDWLCACAVYPQVTWELTLYLGYWLFGGDQKWREEWDERVLRLVRLPWFRYGTMPDWWRERLLDKLQGEKEAIVRRGIECLLRSALEQPDEPVTLEYAKPEDKSFRAQLRAWWQRQRLFWGLRMIEPDEPLRDYVFLRFLAGQRPNRLGVRVPEMLRRVFFIKGHYVLGWRPITISLLALLCSVTTLLTFWLGQTKPDNQINLPPQQSSSSPPPLIVGTIPTPIMSIAPTPIVPRTPTFVTRTTPTPIPIATPLYEALVMPKPTVTQPLREASDSVRRQDLSIDNVKPQDISIGQQITGELTASDQIQLSVDNSKRTYFYDTYYFRVAVADTTVAIDLRSTQFDAAIILYRVYGKQLIEVASDDQSGGYGDGRSENNNALLLTMLPTIGDYVIFATSSDLDPKSLGKYTLGLKTNVIRKISYGESFTNAETSTAHIQTSAGTYLDAYWFTGQSGDRVQIKLSSSTFDSFLMLQANNNGFPIASDDNSGGGQDAQIERPLSESGRYIIIATPYEKNRTGVYRLTLNKMGSQ